MQNLVIQRHAKRLNDLVIVLDIVDTRMKSSNQQEESMGEEIKDKWYS